MPKVGRKKFEYTKKGEDEAEAYAKKHGRKVKRKKKPGYTVESVVRKVVTRLQEVAFGTTTASTKQRLGGVHDQTLVKPEGMRQRTQMRNIQRKVRDERLARENPTTRRRAAEMARRGTPTGRRGIPTR